ncbi:alanine racemase [Streptomyces sp. TBY4]|uniref:alanine racemase n=1 Tax=Streptomyces sp. TBY4 TaxID=2962030 RepID=UPI0020B6803A|nr:alanine racemase [Streptomyces sp. TBY4]MCP3759533.1 alanine racemase [Streptomyces sp. TBY4]
MTDHRFIRAEVTVDLDAIRHNAALLFAHAEGAEMMAVVKADGYGHGAVEVARAALGAGATWLGACSAEEARALRKAGIDAPILAWLDLPDADVPSDVDLGVSSLEQLRALSGRRIHLKIDTGLARNGCPPRLWPDLVRAAAASDNEVYAIWSHLACADEPGQPSVDRQAQRFADAFRVARDAGLDPKRHLANSAATLNRPDLHFDMVRVGIALYGLNPVPGTMALRPAMTLRSSVVMTRRIAAGERVSYGGSWTAERPTTLALVPVGYADGVPRGLSNRFDVLIGGVRRPVRGLVCMDQIVVDCGDEDIAVGTEVVLFGSGSGGEPTAREWADTLGTIDQEIVTGMSRPRLQRRYTG